MAMIHWPCTSCQGGVFRGVRDRLTHCEECDGHGYSLRCTVCCHDQPVSAGSECLECARRERIRAEVFAEFHAATPVDGLWETCPHTGSRERVVARAAGADYTLSVTGRHVCLRRRARVISCPILRRHTLDPALSLDDALAAADEWLAGLRQAGAQ